MKKPLILITNDDGVFAKGLHALIDVMQDLGEVVVVAPDKPQSGMAHAISVVTPIRLEKINLNGLKHCYKCSGTPVDCVKVAIFDVLKRKPDLCVSGINHGSNSSINVIYSGTMSAAIEGAIEGIPSAGFSFLNYNLNADFTVAQKYVKIVATNLLKNKLPEGTLLNVNIPDIAVSKIKGMRICRQALAKWEDSFDVYKNSHKEKTFVLKGEFVVNDKGDDTDEWALANNYVSIVPVQFDLTAHHVMPYINKWSYEE